MIFCCVLKLSQWALMLSTVCSTVHWIFSGSYVNWYGYKYQTKLNHCHRTFSPSLWSEMHFVYVKLYSVKGCFEHASISGIVEELIWHSTVLETKQNTNSTIVTYLQFCLCIFNCICVRSTFSAYFMITYLYVSIFACIVHTDIITMILY